MYLGKSVTSLDSHSLRDFHVTFIVKCTCVAQSDCNDMSLLILGKVICNLNIINQKGKFPLQFASSRVCQICHRNLCADFCTVCKNTLCAKIPLSGGRCLSGAMDLTDMKLWTLYRWWLSKEGTSRNVPITGFGRGTYNLPEKAFQTQAI